MMVLFVSMWKCDLCDKHAFFGVECEECGEEQYGKEEKKKED